MATNEILQFAETDTGTNLLTQSEYAADSQRPIGNQPGVARSKLVNKALRQASLIAAGLAEYIADNQANNITDALTPQNIADYLQAAITGALGVTPPQFDNDTSLATTAFVQRALGSYAGFRELAASTTLTAADVGKAITVNNNAVTITLPDADSLPNGAAITFCNVSPTSGASFTVASQGSDTIWVNTGQGLTSFSLGPNESVTLFRFGANAWKQSSGQIGFTRSFGTNGFQRLPSGLIIQYGRAAFGVGVTQITQTLPLTFPGALRVVTAIELGATPTIGFSAYNFTLSNFQLVSTQGNVTACWVAIGE